MRLGNSLRREEKSEDGEEPVETSIQSSITGTATGGSRRKLLQREVAMGSIELNRGEKLEIERFPDGL